MLVENEFKKLKRFTSGYYRGKIILKKIVHKKYLVFQPMHRYFWKLCSTDYVLLWKYKGLSDENIEPPTRSDNILNPSLSYYSTKTRVKSDGNYLKQDKTTFNHGKIFNIYIVYKINAPSSNTNDPTLKNSLFGAVRLTKISDIDKYQYSGYGIGFDRRGTFSFPGGGFGQNKKKFWSRYELTKNDNKKKYIF